MANIVKRRRVAQSFWAAFTALFMPACAMATTTNWADWTLPGSYPLTGSTGSLSFHYATGASGTVAIPGGGSAAITLSGEVMEQSSNFAVWADSESLPSSYDIGTVSSPDGQDRITQTGYTLAQYKYHTVSFDTSVSGVVMGIWSLGGGQVSSLLFSRDFEIIDTEASGLTKTVTAQGYMLTGTDATSGSSGAGGIIQFYGTFDSATALTYTVTAPEYYSGMSIALTDNVLAGTSGSDITVDVTGPTLSSSSPADEATGVDRNADISLTFNENIVAGTGSISLYKADGTLVQAFDVTSEVTIADATLTLNPSVDLVAGASYYIQVAATAVKDSTGNSFAGIADTTTLNFTVTADPDPGTGTSSGSVASPLTSPAAGDVSNCTAQDINTVSFQSLSVYNVCASTTDTGRARVRITYKANSQRYDLTFTNSVAGDGLVGGSGAMQTYLGDTAAGTGLTKDATIEYTCADNDHDGLVDVTGIFAWEVNDGTFVLPTPPAQPVINTPKCTAATLYNINGLSTSAFADTIAPVITGPVGPTVDDGTTTAANSAITVNENQTAVVQVSATDNLSASANITWSLSGTDAAKFDIAADGTITFVAAPDYENPADADTNNLYVVVITAEDEAGNQTTQTLTVTVANLDEVAPVITGPVGPTAADGTTTGATSAITVDENQTGVTQVTADETVTWSLSGDDAAKFSIAADGTITFVSAPDYENPTDAGDTALNNTYVVVIRATDTSGNYTEQTLTVTVAQVLFPGEPVPLAQDADQDGIPDAVESSVADRDGDGIVDSADYDPQGYFYCQADGRILTGGSVSVTGPGTVTMVSNGSTAGEYQWYVNAPGTYTMAINTSGMEFGTIATTSAGTLTLASQPGNPIVLGSTENGTTGYLGAFNGTPYNPASPTAYYTTFVIAEGDANVIANNIPFAGCGANEVSVAGTTNAVEPNNGTAQDGVFTISLTRAAPVDTVITYSVSGTATSGTDFTALSGTVTIPAGQTSATITVPVLEDGLVEGAETVVLTLTGVTGDSATALASTPTASITIGDDLIDTIRDALSDVLASDLARTVDTQSRQFAAMSKGALGRLQNFDEAACDVAEPFALEGETSLTETGLNANQSLYAESYDCATRTRRITSGSLAANSVEGMGTQGMLSFAVQTERLLYDNDLRGRFWGGYLSRNTVSGVAEGTIDGLGLNGGLYGARKLDEELFVDYYAALAAGRHRFDLTFANTTADITATGNYSYVAAFGGLALSGQKDFATFTLRPRAGVDLAYAKASNATVTARQLALSDTGTVAIPSYQGVRGFAELVFAFGDARDEPKPFAPLISYEFAPRVVCQNALDGAGHECGFGGYVDYLWALDEEGLRFGLKLDYEHVGQTDAASLELRREHDILDGKGQVVTSVSTSSGGDPQIGHGVQINF